MIAAARPPVQPQAFVGRYVTVNSWDGESHDLTDRVGLGIDVQDHYVVVEFTIDGTKVEYLIDPTDLTLAGPLQHGGEA